MAYIYSKNSGNCLIIGPQESITLPFNFGNFQEIRWGGFFSVVAGGSGNFNSIFSGYTGSNFTGPLTQLFMGFKDSGTAIPGMTGSNFVGATKKVGDGSNGPAITSTIMALGSSSSTNGNIVTIDNTGGRFYPINNASIPAQNSMSITTGNADILFASFWGITLGLAGNFFSGMVMYDTNFYTDVSTGNLSRLVNAPPLVSTYASGFYTTGGLNNLNILPTPQAIYIYFPFPNNQLRIHCIDIEQFN